MIVNVTEEQKRVIEEYGFQVIQFKKWCYDFVDGFYKVITDVWNALTFFLREAMERVIVPCIEVIKERMQTFIDTHVDFFNKKDFIVEKTEKFPFIRSLGRKYNPNISYKVIYHRCRDRC